MNIPKSTSPFTRHSQKMMALATAAALVHGIEAHANLIGDNMTLDYRYPDINTQNIYSTGYPESFLVAPGGTTFTGGNNPALTISVTADTITIAYPVSPGYSLGFTDGFSGPPGSPDGATDAGVTFNGAVFTDLTHGFSSVSLDPATTWAGIDASRVAFNGDQLDVNFMGLYATMGASQVVLDVQTLPDSGDSFALCAASIGCLGLVRRLINHTPEKMKTC